MGVGSFAYNLVLLLHILSAIIGFGGVMLNGVYAGQARKRPPAEGLAIMEANTFISLTICEKFIYLVPIWGFGLVGLSDKVWTFGQGWVMASIGLYAVALVLSLFALQPRAKRMVALQREIVEAGPPAGGPPPQVAEMQKIGPQIGAISGVLHLLMTVIIILMIWKPGL